MPRYLWPLPQHPLLAFILVALLAVGLGVLILITDSTTASADAMHAFEPEALLPK